MAIQMVKSAWLFLGKQARKPVVVVSRAGLRVTKPLRDMGRDRLESDNRELMKTAKRLTRKNTNLTTEKAFLALQDAYFKGRASKTLFKS